MKKLFFVLLVMLVIACQEKHQSPKLDFDKLYAWCIVPFDSLERSPEERIEMLQGLGIKKYAYDWRSEHLAQMADELRLAQENDIEVISVWLWIDDQWDSVGALNAANEKVFDIIAEVGYQGQIWLSFNANFFEGLTDAEAVDKGAEMIAYLSKRAAALDCKVALYNHGDWFGEPSNQIKIIRVLPEEELGIIYNFHHAHNQIDRFPEMAKTMMPYLWNVNLNGLRRGGPKILTIGEGDHEAEMMRVLTEKGYKGDWGILGHIEEKDVEYVLKANLAGLRKVKGWD